MGEHQQPPPEDQKATSDHLANERTFLAWVRTAIAVIGLGFVVSRFGFVLRAIRLHVPEPFSTITFSTIIGTFLVFCGAAMILTALLSYRQIGQAISARTYRWSPRFAITLTLLLIMIAILLAFYLIITA